MEMLSTQKMLKKCINQGFTLESISLISKLSIDVLEKILKDNYLSDDFEKHIYLNVFFQQLYFTSPLNEDYFIGIINSLTNYFKISYEAISAYLGINIKDLDLFIESPQIIQNKNEIELKLLHLFTTFVRDMRFSIG